MSENRVQIEHTSEREVTGIRKLYNEELHVLFLCQIFLGRPSEGG
jgi:hypothetical protein